MPRAVIISTAFLCCVSAAIGLWLGLNWQPLDETQVISSVANTHLQKHGGRPEDCLAVPGAANIWVQVICAGTVYQIDHRGQVVAVEEPDA